MHPEPSERDAACVGFRLSDLVLVVGKDEVLTTSVDVDLGAQVA